MAINKRLIKSNDEGPTGPVSFNTVLWPGNGGTNSITGVGFEPDFVWIKNRDEAESHVLFDSIRGATNFIQSNTTIAEATNVTTLTSFDSNGFTLSNDEKVNKNSIDYVAWCWKAGGAAVTNNNGTITSQVSANVDAGFSVVSYTGNGANGTVGHGLGVTPNIIIVKRRNLATAWSISGNTGGLVYGSNKLTLEKDLGFQSDTNEVLAANSNTFTAGTSGAVGASGGTYVAYCFAEVAGFSKFGSYMGNGTSQTITTDFEPAFVLLKSSSNPTNWYIFDNKRGDFRLFPDDSSAEVSGGGAVGLTSTGFTLNSEAYNNSGWTWIYMAFANQF